MSTMHTLTTAHALIPLCALTLPLGVSHGDTVWVATRTSADANESAHALWKQRSSCETLHTAHTRPYTGVQLLYAEVVQQSELRAYHVLHCENRKSSRISLAVGGVDGRWSSRAVAASDNIRADDKVLVCVQRLSGTNEFLPPAWLCICLCAMGMARRG
jgi:hypothetical protein